MNDRQPGEILFTAAQIQSRVAEMAAEIRRDVPEGLHLVAVLKGAFMFLADLARHLDGDVSLEATGPEGSTFLWQVTGVTPPD